jgi:four helix bundle protein
MNSEITEERGLETLQIWKRSLEFALRICKEVIPNLPKDEKWAMTDQLRRAVQSIPANIAESYGRYHYQDSIRFCYIAIGSLEETYSHLILACRLGYLDKAKKEIFISEIVELRRMLNGYISFLKRSKRGINEPGTEIHELSVDYTFENDR